MDESVINIFKFMQRLGLLGLLFVASVVSAGAWQLPEGQVGLAANEVVVSRTGPYFNLRSAIGAAGPGGVVRLRAGRYGASDLSIPYDLTIIGEGEVIITSPRPVAKGLLVPVRGTKLEVRGLVFLNAKSPDQNGAGIRFEGRELIVSNCAFINNENGILATGAAASEVVVLSSRFVANGFGDGRSHGIYLSQGASLVVENSQFEDTRIGHHVKSIAVRQTIIRNNKFEDGNGQPSYVVDVTGGGEMLVEGNEVNRRASAEQETLFNYDTSRRGVRGRVTLRSNQIINEKPGAQLLRNPEKVPVYLADNSFENRNGGTLALPVSTPDLYQSDRDQIDLAQVPSREFVFADDSAAGEGQTGQGFGARLEADLVAKPDLSGLSPVQRRSVEQMLGRETIPVQADQVPVNAAYAAVQERQAIDRSRRQRQVTNDVVQRAIEVPVTPFSAQPLVPEPVAQLSEKPDTTKQGRPSLQERATVSRPSMRAAQQAQERQSQPAVLVLPRFRKRTARQQLVALNLLPAKGARATSGLITLGQVFKNRALQPTQAIALEISNNLYPVQMDVKATYRDGSVRHAVLSIDLTGLKPQRGQAVQAMLVKTDQVSSKPDLTVDPEYNLVVDVQGTLADGTSFAGSVPLGPLVAEKIAAGQGWLSGPFAVEASVASAVGPFLQVRADVRFLADRSVRTRLSFENHKTFVQGNRDLVYDIAVSAGGRKLFQRRNIKHSRGTNWSETIWRGRQAGWLAQADTAYLIATGAVPPYDLSYGIKGDVVARNASRLQNDRGLFGAGLMSKYFPTTGGRDDIGLLPGWDVHWLKSQSSLAKETMVAMAERAGAVPWHFEDEATGQPVRLDQRPKFWAVEDGANGEYAPDQIPVSYFSGSDGGWELDNAHKPLLSYTPYLATGDAYYARELAHEAAFSLARIWPGLRQGKPLLAEAIQVRSRAWALRDIANAAWLLPDDAPLKDYFQKSLLLNLRFFLETYVFEERMARAGETEGWFAESVNGDPERISPWQNDYLVMVLAQEAERGSAVAGEILLWTSKYHKGRFLAAAAVPGLGAASVHAAKDKQGVPRGTWEALMEITATRPEAAENYAAYGGGYVASAYGALASLYSATGDEELLQAIKALYTAQKDQRLFDLNNDGSVYVVPSYLLSVRGPAGIRTSLTGLFRTSR